MVINGNDCPFQQTQQKRSSQFIIRMGSMIQEAAVFIQPSNRNISYHLWGHKKYVRVPDTWRNTYSKECGNNLLPEISYCIHEAIDNKQHTIRTGNNSSYIFQFVTELYLNYFVDLIQLARTNESTALHKLHTSSSCSSFIEPLSSSYEQEHTVLLYHITIVQLFQVTNGL